MAIITANNLGRLKKKSGPNVFRKWRNLQVMGVYNSAVRNPNSNSQKVVRSAFAAAARLAAAYAQAIMVGFENVCKGTKVPQRGYFVKLNWDKIHGNASGAATIDYEDLVVSKGDLPQIQFGNAAFANPLQVDIPINDGASVYGSHRDDIVYILVYDPETNEAITSDIAKRTDEEVNVHVPTYWVGDRVHVYGFGKGADANPINPGDLSDSHYLGSGTIA